LIVQLLISNTQNILATNEVVYRNLLLPQTGPLLVKPIQVLLEYISQNLRSATIRLYSSCYLRSPPLAADDVEAQAYNAYHLRPAEKLVLPLYLPSRIIVLAVLLQIARFLSPGYRCIILDRT
jgi:hypothetical protein